MKDQDTVRLVAGRVHVAATDKSWASPWIVRLPWRRIQPRLARAAPAFHQSLSAQRVLRGLVTRACDHRRTEEEAKALNNIFTHSPPGAFHFPPPCRTRHSMHVKGAR